MIVMRIAIAITLLIIVITHRHELLSSATIPSVSSATGGFYKHARLVSKTKQHLYR
jgi:hypothetical protein